MDNPQLRDAVATALNRAIDLPLVPEEYEQILFARLVETIWLRLPTQIRQSISSGAVYIEQDQLESVSKILGRVLDPIISKLFWWRDDASQISKMVQLHLLGMSAKNVTAESYLA